ncbi:MAG: redoxin domain-containing protein [Mariprofundaceae bacterium]|nr:redoxin domain-containing protein [Mariprofundaceae bacterium]
MYSVKISVIILLLTTMVGCGGDNNLIPSNRDLRPTVTAGSTGHLPSQKLADFNLQDSLGNTWRLSDHLNTGLVPADATVLYFTMWCPICLAHSDHMLYTVIPKFAARGTTNYVLVDYVSGSVVGARSSEISNGYNNSPFTVLADSTQSLMQQLNASMGTTVVVDRYGTVLMNEDYRTGSNLTNILNGILP